jgi:hypothetical protein
MAKGQKNSGREKKKPKASAKPAPAPVSPFTQPPSSRKPSSKTGGG